MKIFKEDMLALQNTTENGNIPAYKRLLTEEYWKIPDEEFLNVINEIIEEVKKGKIEIVEVVKLYAYFSYFSRKKLILYDIPTLKSIFIAGMNISSIHSKYCEDIEEELAKIAIDQIEEDMEDILKKFYELNEQLKYQMYKQKAEEIFKCIPMKMEKFYDRFDKECMEIPIFRYQEPYQIFQRILYASNEDIVIIKDKLINRAEKFGGKLIEEAENLRHLKELMDEYTKDKSISIKIVMLKEFSKDIDYMLEKYETIEE